MSIDRTVRKMQVMGRLARDLATLSTCARIKVGAVLFPPDCSRVVALGFNGQPAGLSHDGCSGDPCGCIHAEANLVAKFDSPPGARLIMWSTLPPCWRCAGLMINCGRVGALIYDRSTVGHSYQGLRDLVKAGIVIAEAEAIHSAPSCQSAARIVEKLLLMKDK